MAQLGLKEAVLLEAGLLAQRDDGSTAPRFRGRLLFPIHDLRGRVVGFGGRLLGPGEPKYLNSPETPIYKKGTMLYNLHDARQAIRKGKRRRGRRIFRCAATGPGRLRERGSSAWHGADP